ncbi:MAG: hypothetical protein KGL39_07525 [Patescibacteria group bacterium]|nr:hypothetical protein [Patescibacteria group bacterium]
MSDFQIVENERAASVARHPKNKESNSESRVADQLLKLIVSGFSERTLAIFSALFTIGALASAFFVWWLVISTPSDLRLIGATIYSVFVLLFEFVRKGQQGKD